MSKERKKSIGTIAAFLIVPLVLKLVYKETVTNTRTILSYGLMFALVVSLNFWGLLSSAKKIKVIQIKKTTIYFVGIVVIELIVSVMIAVFFDVRSINQSRIDGHTEMMPIFVVVVIALAPIYEELVFRYSLMKIFGKYKRIGIVISGILFGVIHAFPDFLYDPIQLIMTIPIIIGGFCLGYLYFRTDNIWMPILAHMLFNVVGL